MIELLVLYELNEKVLTMYGISKEIKKDFSVLTTPSFGTIKPALRRLEKSGFLKIQKTISAGGRPSIYYSITEDGKCELKRLIMQPPLENPIHFLPSARVKLSCAELLNKDEQIFMLKNIKAKAESLLIDTQNIVKNENLAYYPKMVFDNLTTEYKNFISLIEGFEHACTH